MHAANWNWDATLLLLLSPSSLICQKYDNFIMICNVRHFLCAFNGKSQHEFDGIEEESRCHQTIGMKMKWIECAQCDNLWKSRCTRHVSHLFARPDFRWRREQGNWEIILRWQNNKYCSFKLSEYCYFFPQFRNIVAIGSDDFDVIELGKIRVIKPPCDGITSRCRIRQRPWNPYKFFNKKKNFLFKYHIWYFARILWLVVVGPTEYSSQPSGESDEKKNHNEKTCYVGTYKKVSPPQLTIWNINCATENILMQLVVRVASNGAAAAHSC